MFSSHTIWPTDSDNVEPGILLIAYDEAVKRVTYGYLIQRLPVTEAI